MKCTGMLKVQVCCNGGFLPDELPTSPMQLLLPPGEERGNEIRKVVIAHGSVEFCEVTPIGLADESKEVLYGSETGRDLRNADLRSSWTCRCVA